MALLAARRARELLAGGTNRCAISIGGAQPRGVGDISRAAESTESSDGTGLGIGALATNSAVRKPPYAIFPALVDASHTVGAVRPELGYAAGKLVTCGTMDGGTTSSRGGHRDGRVIPGKRDALSGFCRHEQDVLKPDEMLLDMVIPKRISATHGVLNSGCARGRRGRSSTWLQARGSTTEAGVVEPRIALCAVDPS